MVQEGGQGREERLGSFHCCRLGSNGIHRLRGKLGKPEIARLSDVCDKRYVNVGAANRALEVLPEILKVVGVRVAVHVLFSPVIYGFVFVAMLLDHPVSCHLIGVTRRALDDVLLNQRNQSCSFHIWHNFRHHLTAAFQHPKHECLALGSASTYAGTITADNCFIHFHIAFERPLAINFGNVLPDKIGHAPRGLVRHAKLTLQFLRGNTMPGRGEKVDGIKPELQRSARVLERRPGGGVKMMPAPLANVGAFSLEPKPFGFAVALRAHMALTVAVVEKVFQTRFIIRELDDELTESDTGLLAFLGFLLPRFHGANIRQIAYLCQGDNSEIFSIPPFDSAQGRRRTRRRREVRRLLHNDQRFGCNGAFPSCFNCFSIHPGLLLLAS